MALLMRSRLFWRRSAAAAGTYASAALGFGATVVALHVFSTETFGRYALVLAATSLAQSLLDLTVEEALVKFGFRFTTREDWGRLRRLFESAIVFKLGGGILATGLLLAFAPVADTVLHKDGLTTATDDRVPSSRSHSARRMSAASRSLLRGRYDVRAFFLFVSMALRFSAIAVAAPHGSERGPSPRSSPRRSSRPRRSPLRGGSRYRRFPLHAAVPLGDERREIISFAAQSCVATGCHRAAALAVPLLLGCVVDARAGRVSSASRRRRSRRSPPSSRRRGWSC